MKALIPDQHLDSVFDLNPDHLWNRGIRGIITDLDNTLVPWNDRSVTPRLAEWFLELKKKGFRLCIVSNNSRDSGGEVAR
ncbi:MAG: YqeG family HAD IIIA-type phosphatase, partial [Bacillota bacterium]